MGKMVIAGVDKLLRYINVFLALFIVVFDRSLHIKAATVHTHNVSLTNITRMYNNLRHIPEGSTSVTHLNLAYNNIERLDNFTFIEKHYREVQKLYFFRNAIDDVGVDAFKGLSRLETLDMSDNNLTTLAQDTFVTNERLHELILINNHIRFERHAIFLRSTSLRTLSLNNNRITDVYDATFSGVTNLKRLMLGDNTNLLRLSPKCFKSLSKLKYLSLTNTGVHRIHIHTFLVLPRIIMVEGTPFAQSFHPPLTQLTSRSFAELARFDQLLDEI